MFRGGLCQHSVLAAITATRISREITEQSIISTNHREGESNQAGKINLLHIRRVNGFEEERRQRCLSEAILEQISLGLMS